MRTFPWQNIEGQTWHEELYLKTCLILHSVETVLTRMDLHAAEVFYWLIFVQHVGRFSWDIIKLSFLMKIKHLFLTLSSPAFSAVRQARGGCGSEAWMPQIKLNMNRLKWNFAWVIMSIKSSWCKIWGWQLKVWRYDVTKFPSKKGTSHQIRLFTPGKRF